MIPPTQGEALPVLAEVLDLSFDIRLGDLYPISVLSISSERIASRMSGSMGLVNSQPRCQELFRVGSMRRMWANCVS